MPRQLLCVGVGKLEWNEYEEPALQPGQIRVLSQFTAAKHGTELAMYKGYSAARGPFDRDLKVFTYRTSLQGPRFNPGNMTVGIVTQTAPDVTNYAVGDRVLIYGGFKQTHTVGTDRGCWKIPQDVSWKSVVCLDPADFALGAVRDGHVRIGDNVAIFGLGAIGLMAVQLCRASGAARIIAIDPLASRREIARDLGADVLLDPAACDAGLEIKKATDSRGADVVIEYSGTWRAMQAALRGVAYGGNVVAGAFPPPYEAGLDFGAEAHLNIPNIVFSRSCSEPNRDYPRWDERRIFGTCLKMLICDQLRGDPIVSPVVKFDELLDVYPRIQTDPGTFIKLGAEY